MEAVRKLKRIYMKSLRHVISYTSNIRGFEKVSKRAWAEYFEMERRLIRLKFLSKLYGMLLLGLIMGLVMDKFL